MQNLYLLCNGDSHFESPTTVTEEVSRIYQQEWEKLVKDENMRKHLVHFNPEYIASFSFEDIYDRMQALAPSFLTLIESLVEHTESTRAPGADTERRKRRHIVMALATIASLSNQQFVICGLLALSQRLSIWYMLVYS